MNPVHVKEIAAQRQLDWLLGERLGRGPAAAATPVAARHPLLVAALVALALGAAFGVGMLSRDPGDGGGEPVPAQVEQIEWYEAHGPAAAAAIPTDVVNLRCFDFDDDAVAKLAGLRSLERLDLSGMDVNSKGYSVSLPITDEGVRHLGGFTKLRWLSLEQCHAVTGATLTVLEGLPQLDRRRPHVGEGQVEVLELRELSLSYCMAFHGRSLAEVAKIPGLRRLELRGCVTLAAGDVAKLGALRELRHLDLRDCQGRFRGQTMSMGDEPADRPKQDGIGLTDAAIAALTDLPLQTLLLGGCEALTDAVGPSLAEFGKLRELDLGGLPKVTTAVLAGLPRELQALSLDGDFELRKEGLEVLREFRALRELGLRGVKAIDDAALAALLEAVPLRTIRLGGVQVRELRPSPRAPIRPSLTAGAADVLAQHPSLESIELGYTDWVDAAVLTRLAALPALAELGLSESQGVADGALGALAKSASLRRLTLVGCRALSIEDLAACAGAPLTELNLRATRLPEAGVRELAPKFPGCTIVLSDGQRLTVPR